MYSSAMTKLILPHAGNRAPPWRPPRRDGHVGRSGQEKVEAAIYDVVISDIKMPGIDGVELLQYANTACPEAERIVITAHEEFDIAKRVAESGGVFQFIGKGPSLPSAVAHSVNQAMEKITLRRQNLAFRRDAAQHNSLENIVGSSTPMQKLKRLSEPSPPPTAPFWSMAKAARARNW